MKKTFIPLLLAIATCCVIFWFNRAKKSSEPDISHTLIVGTSADFPPFAFRDINNEIRGFDIAVVKEVAKRINLTPIIEDMRFEMLLPELQMGHIHVIAAGMTPTPERAKSVLFTKPYLTENPLVVVTLASNPVTSLEDLKGKEVIVNTGYTADAFMSKIKDIELTRLTTIAEAFASLESGGGFAFVTAANTLKPILDKKQADRFSFYTLDETDEDNALAISKKYPELLPKIQQALDEMKTEGFIDALKVEWQIA